MASHRYLLLALLITVSAFVIEAARSSKSANTEWPVFFEHLGLVHSIHNKWDLTLSTTLHLSKLESRILKTIHRLGLLSGKYEKEAESKFRSVEEKSRLEELKESWSKLNRQLSRRTETMRRRAKNVKSIGNQLTSSNMMVRKKRQSENDLEKQATNQVDAVIQLTGGVLQSLFGVAYTDDVRKVVNRIDKIDEGLKQEIGGVSASQDSLQHNTRETLTKQDGVIKMVEKMAKQVERKVADMETNPYLKTEIGNLVRSRSELYQNLQLELNLIEERLGEIERVVINLSNGRLNQNILPPQKLKETLATIEAQLPANYSLLFPSKGSLWPYYSLLSVTASFDPSMDSVDVRLSVPLVDHVNVLDLTKVHNLPLKAKDGYSVKVDLSVEYLVTDSSRNHFLELHKEDFADCQVYHTGLDRHFYCGLPPLLDATTTRSCVMQLYQGRLSSEWCQSKLIYGMVQPFSRLYNGSWVFSALTENVQVTLQCPDGNIPTSLMGFGIVGLAEGCTISNEEFWYPHTFAGAMQLNLNFGDKGWDNSEFHTDLSEGQEDWLDFPDDEFQQDLAAVADQSPTIVLKPETGANEDAVVIATARSISTSTTPEDTTTSSAEKSTDSTSSSSSTNLFSTVTNTEGSTDVVQSLLVQDPENKATEVHNDILLKLREQLRLFNL